MKQERERGSKEKARKEWSLTWQMKTEEISDRHSNIEVLWPYLGQDSSGECIYTKNQKHIRLGLKVSTSGLSWSLRKDQTKGGMA